MVDRQQLTKMTLEELGDSMVNLARTEHFKNEWRRRRPLQMAPFETDPGHFDVGKYNKLKGTWLFFCDGKYDLARLQGSKWEQFKAEHPNWRDSGNE